VPLPSRSSGKISGGGEGVRLASHPNADAARLAFLANLVGVGTETFEGFAPGTPAPLSISFAGAGTATLTGSGASVASVPSGTNGVGRYPVSGNQYLETGFNFTINFSDPIAAFGFYGVDVGDFGGQVTLTATNGHTEVLTIPNTINGLGGSVIYFGFYDLENQYTSIAFGNTAAGTDYFGFDDMTIGSIEQVSPVPEPASMLLLGLGLLIGGASVTRRRK